MMPILMANPGDVVTVARVTGSPNIKQRLGELGFVAGTEVSVIQSNGGNMIVKVKDSKLALTKEMASKIMMDIKPRS